MSTKRKLFTTVSASVFWRSLFCLFVQLIPLTSRCEEGEKPNFLIIVSDDQRIEDFELVMPLLAARVKSSALSFERAYVTTPMCCPSRSSIFTGRYASHHGVTANGIPLQEKTIADRFRSAGYYTALIGKYLNSWSGEKRDEFDFWVSFKKGVSRYFDPELNVQGAWGVHKGYITALLGGYVQQVIRERAQDSKPFLLFFTPNAPHPPMQPAPGDEKLFADLAPYRPPSFNTVGPSKPAFVKKSKPLTVKDIAEIDAFRRLQGQTLFALDRAVGKIFQELERTHTLQKTVVLYISDNGVLWGEFGMQRKVSAYEPSVHVPFFIFGTPPLNRVGSSDALVANIDIAPTLCELGKVPANPAFDGASLVPLLSGNATSVRSFLFLESWRASSNRKPFFAVHTGSTVYIRNIGATDELYSLDQDPFQLENLVDSPEYAAERERLRKILEKREKQ
ncbi:MAG: sulfatase-like hydrolase/transferase [Bdellovibrionales bacterium]|nr:sulfatase-like hydrolase/transferase [Bdellovibrionales bacterium]